LQDLTDQREGGTEENELSTAQRITNLRTEQSAEKRAKSEGGIHGTLIGRPGVLLSSCCVGNVDLWESLVPVL